jgi:small GTP-binding protein
MIARVLSLVEADLLAREREWLGRLQVALARFDVPAGDQAALEQSVRQLDQLFLLIVVGEFNAGKSAFINALLGARILEEGVTPTTTRVQVLTYGAEPGRSGAGGAVDVVTAPVEILRAIDIVDTPGTNAIYREHETITAGFVPRADIVLFVTSADRPFTESERAFLQAIREWGKKIVVAINKVDILETLEEVQSVEAFVARSAASLLGFEPQVFPVSARAALRAKLGAAPPRVAGDRFEELERFVSTVLDERERIRLKLLNPIGVATKVIEGALEVIAERLRILEDDVTAIDDIEAQVQVYRSDMQRDFQYRLSHVDNVLHEFERRGVEFFDETLRLARVLDLLNRSRLKADFERKVVADVPQVIERSVQDVIDWMVSSDLRHWQGVMDRIQGRRTAHAGRLVGDVGGAFSYDRSRLLDTVGRAAEQAVQTYDQEREASAMAESVRLAVAGTALAEAGAISLGAAVTALASTTFADVTGILAASALAVLGLFVIPVRRQQAKQALRGKIGGMRGQLMSSLTGQFGREVERSLERIREAIGPYTRFVRAERDRLAGMDRELRTIREELGGIASSVRALT